MTALSTLVSYVFSKHGSREQNKLLIFQQSFFKSALILPQSFDTPLRMVNECRILVTASLKCTTINCEHLYGHKSEPSSSGLGITNCTTLSMKYPTTPSCVDKFLSFKINDLFQITQKPQCCLNRATFFNYTYSKLIKQQKDKNEKENKQNVPSIF